MNERNTNTVPDVPVFDLTDKTEIPYPPEWYMSAEEYDEYLCRKIDEAEASIAAGRVMDEETFEKKMAALRVKYGI